MTGEPAAIAAGRPREVEVTRTYLEMTSPPAAAPEPGREGLRLERVTDCPVSFWRYLYGEVGRAHHWRDRLAWSDGEVRAYLARAELELWVLYDGGAPAGYFELLGHGDGSTEIAYFGLLPERVGRGLGRRLLEAAIARAWERRPTRLWLHTCTLDHPSALPNYLRRGFRPFREEKYRTLV